MKKQRGHRQNGVRAQLTPDTLEAMVFIALNRWVTTHQVFRELYLGKASERRCRARIRQLFDAGYLDITLVASTMPNLISVSSEGLAVLKERFPGLANRLKRPGTIRLSGVGHHLHLVDVRTYLAAWCQQSGKTLLQWESGQGALAKALGLGHWRLRPDALAEVEEADGLMRIAVEADNGTEVPEVIEKKLERYFPLLATDQTLDELWISVSTGMRRRQGIAKMVRTAGIEPWTRVMAHDLLLPRPALEPDKVVGGAGYEPKGSNTSCNSLPKPQSSPQLRCANTDSGGTAVGTAVGTGKMQGKATPGRERE